MAICRVCKEAAATLPEGAPERRFCPQCWDKRLVQLFQEEDRFRIQRVSRSQEAERYLLYHDEHEGGASAVGVIFALQVGRGRHLEVSAFLLDRITWTQSVPFIYEQGIEFEVELMDVFLGVLEADLIASWQVQSWTAEVTFCHGEPFWIDSRDRGGDMDAPEGDWEPE
jgi:hypothetical protein